LVVVNAVYCVIVLANDLMGNFDPNISSIYMLVLTV